MSFRSPQFPLGLSAPPLGPTTGGFSSLLAFWLGGASSSAEVVPPVTPGGGGWGRVSLKHVEIVLREELFPEFSEEERAAILAAIVWCLK